MRFSPAIVRSGNCRDFVVVNRCAHRRAIACKTRIAARRDLAAGEERTCGIIGRSSIRGSAASSTRRSS